MPELYTFEDHNLRIVFIDGKPWFVGEDMGPCLGFTRDDFMSLAQSWQRGLEKKDTVILEVPNAEGEPTLTRLYSLEMAIRFACVVTHPSAYRFRKWLEDVFGNADAPMIYPACVGKECPHLSALTNRLGRGMMAMNSVIDLIGAIYTSGRDLHAVNTQNLAYLLDLVRDEFKATENLVTFACRCVNGHKPR